MSKIAFIYPGQGAQVCGRGQDFYEQTEIGKQVFIWQRIFWASLCRSCASQRTTDWILPSIRRQPW